MDRDRDREANRKVAANTLECLEKGFYKKGKNIDISKMVTAAKSNSVVLSCWDDLPLDPSPGVITQFVVSIGTTLASCERLALAQANPRETSIAVLNFASAKNPGGGFIKGANAQEESLARASALYPCLAQHKQFYCENAQDKTRNYTDNVIYSPTVPVFKNDYGLPLDGPYCVSFISSPAPNAKVGDRKTTEEMQPIFLQRITRILQVAIHNKNQTIVLGAFGCGVFGNDPLMVAGVFKQLLCGDYAGYFTHVEFAITDPGQATIFGQVFEVEAKAAPKPSRR